MTIHVHPVTPKPWEEPLPAPPVGPTRAERLSIRESRWRSLVQARDHAGAGRMAKDTAWLCEMWGDEDAATEWHCRAEWAAEVAG